MQYVIAIRDVKSECFKAPHFSIAKGAAIRDFGDAVNDPKSFLAQHPEDYQLFLVATFDDRSGEVIPERIPSLLASASDFIKIKSEV